jgi:hypothetical protein
MKIWNAVKSGFNSFSFSLSLISVVLILLGIVFPGKKKRFKKKTTKFKMMTFKKKYIP